MTIKLITINLLLIISTGVMACGTPDNWMDAYEGVKSNNKWRDSMNQLESLIMLNGCAVSSMKKLNVDQKGRLSLILKNSIDQRTDILIKGSGHYETRDMLKVVRYNPYAYMGLLESIYRSANCLAGAPISSLDDDVFGYNFCPEGDLVWMTVSAKSGGIIRLSPGGKKVGALKDGASVRIVGQSENKEWYRVYMPNRKLTPAGLNISYMHLSILVSQ